MYIRSGLCETGANSVSLQIIHDLFDVDMFLRYFNGNEIVIKAFKVKVTSGCFKCTCFISNLSNAC